MTKEEKKEWLEKEYDLGCYATFSSKEKLLKNLDYMYYDFTMLCKELDPEDISEEEFVNTLVKMWEADQK